MDLNGLLKQFTGNAETMLFGTAMHYFQSGTVDTKHLDADAMALSLTSALAQVDHEHPGIASKYGWVKLSEVEAFTTAAVNASQATPPPGLH